MLCDASARGLLTDGKAPPSEVDTANIPSLETPLLVSWWMVPSEEPFSEVLGISAGREFSPEDGGVYRRRSFRVW